eukprot:4311682-Amphidinium_carterae.1
MMIDDYFGDFEEHDNHDDMAASFADELVRCERLKKRVSDQTEDETALTTPVPQTSSTFCCPHFPGPTRGRFSERLCNIRIECDRKIVAVNSKVSEVRANSCMRHRITCSTLTGAKSTSKCWSAKFSEQKTVLFVIAWAWNQHRVDIGLDCPYNLTSLLI